MVLLIAKEFFVLGKYPVLNFVALLLWNFATLNGFLPRPPLSVYQLQDQIQNQIHLQLQCQYHLQKEIDFLL